MYNGIDLKLIVYRKIPRSQYEYRLGLEGSCRGVFMWNRFIKEDHKTIASEPPGGSYTALFATITIAPKNSFQKKVFVQICKKRGAIRKNYNMKYKYRFIQVNITLNRLYIEYKVCHSLTQSVI